MGRQRWPEPDWHVDPDVYDDALDQALPFSGPHAGEDAREAAWSARVDNAVFGMNVVDPTNLDVWMDAHAASEVPYIQEALLVSCYEAYIRDAIEEEFGTGQQADDHTL